jgi:hypothetical protein
MRTARQAKNLINAPIPHVADLDDTELHDQLSRWISAKPNLVQPPSRDRHYRGAVCHGPGHSDAP